MQLTDHIRAIPDYPKPGIVFRDITPLLADGAAFKHTVDTLVARYRDQGITKIVGIEARGFIFATALAYALGVGFVPLRKPGKLPRQVVSQRYALEYGEDELQLHADDITATDKVLIIDDLLATGGTVLAAVALVQALGAEIVECSFVITLHDLPGAERLNQAQIPYYTLCEF
ncbi:MULTISPECIES: adenine phosphoribosyltransferase [Idiomarinaceae]|uniref:Adenine phosphoribosyltransferase n=2 Tax=Pseudidiomarina TaxID=2800384 RepID=A0A368V8I9_9GAMM|nr:MULTISPECIES: adenine phosphoribosyltransferase [Idiomarinaceae]MDX1524818.1 adenine phosphoribosyltransferase [Pseudidiomarina maritima]MRJ42347.1 adenine phosphoribosyltransferase [Idiomarina sp. FeN1]NCU57472.1 adenine phosphoribosyltransferase [Idiomarina sp. FenA--70]NCU60659.1 adenine phosphoribosyltransferase [Idiomarina sp. FenBw--71]PWW15966.1 adenine phosphoribosyltransferase [Pseudidiomarina maritima]